MTLPIEGVLDKYEVEYNPDRDGNQLVRCPFHDDKVASASVNLGKALFNCYGCQIAGDGITLLMEQEGLDFGEAKRVAEELARNSDRQVSRGTDTGGTFLPRKSGSRPGRRNWKSPWASRRPGPTA